MSFLFYLILAVPIIIYFLIKRRYNYWKNCGFIQIEPEFPFGNLKGVGTKITSCEALDVHYKKYKTKAPVVGIYSFFTPNLMVTDPELLKNILVRDFTSFTDRGMYHNEKDDPTSAKLVE
jgi:cytochrome P450 family 6